MKFKFTLFCVGLLMACFIQQAAAQTLQVSGTVKSKSTAEPLAGATVSAVGTAQATQTDAKGNFTIGVTVTSRICRCNLNSYCLLSKNRTYPHCECYCKRFNKRRCFHIVFSIG
jgi:hypothetical protein